MKYGIKAKFSGEVTFVGNITGATVPVFIKRDDKARLFYGIIEAKNEDDALDQLTKFMVENGDI